MLQRLHSPLYLILPFTLREVSMCFLLHINEDFDDNLLMKAVDLIE